MYLTEEILDKLNRSLKTQNTNTPLTTLPDIMVCSFAQVKELAGDNLSWGEKNFLWQQAQKELKENRMAESRILSRANPQLANAVRLGIRQSSMLRGYDDLFPQRASNFVKPGSVASMFSPAGYLTELYREARKLHDTDSQYHLDTRRPDLASLSLSQGNMDDELSTLSLSNELLLSNIETQESKDYDGVLEMLSTYRQTGMTPFHLPYEATRQAIMLHDEAFAAFRRNPDVAMQMHTASLLGIEADISPDLYELLTEEITEENADELIKKNFGENVDINIFQSPAYMAHYYGLTQDELASLLGMVTASKDVNPGEQYYRNDSLVSIFSGDDGALSAKLIQRSPVTSVFFDYIELLPASGTDYYINFKCLRSPVSPEKLDSFKIRLNGNIWLYTTSDESVKSQTVAPGVVNSFNIVLAQEILEAGADITIEYEEYQHRIVEFSTIFTLSIYPFNHLLLMLNKLFRLYRATGIAPSDIRAIIESDTKNSDLNISSDGLSKLFWVRYYMQRYDIDVSAALVLSGADISQINHSGEDSAFNRLFNTPRLNNAAFFADGTELNLMPGSTADSFRTGVLKRAFQVNDTELYSLWSLAQGSATPPDFTTTIDNLSVMYRVKLLADVHGLSVTELAALLSVSPYAASGIAAISQTETELAGLVSFLDQYTRWLKDEDWTVSDLYLMTTDRYSTALSPDIENLATTLKDGLANQDLSQADNAGFIRAAAPFIAAATQLDSAETATALLQWLDQLKPQGLTVKAFLALVAQFTSDGDNTKLVAFCQVLGQLALIVRTLRLTAGEISLAVTQSGKLLHDSQTLPQDIATVRALARFHHWLQQCGTSATEILSALGSGTLTPAQLAQAMMLDKQMVSQGLAQTGSETALFSSWAEIDITLQWVDFATTLGITPAGVRSLINVKLSDNANPTTWSDWVALSNTLQAGLSSRQTAQLQAIREEALSTALSAFAIKNIAPSWVTDRDKLYSWLLIDSQVSAQIKTTRLAEAIASVQLYVNRALSGQEEGVVNAVKSGQFFTTDWDTYNKRYSTWAGVSQLVYYPENYVDPTLRIGQTGMMDEMLQSLSQSQLTSDTVEEAFKTYMTRFEEIANLDIISGYHNSVSELNGTTWLLGRSAIGDYYWRSVDIEKMADGKLPANAWSEWKKITAAVTPVNNMVRPVIFQSRLYLVWVEGRDISVASSNANDKSVEYLLKYAHILHDGTWSAPVTVKPEADILPPKTVDIINTGMYCARDTEQEKLYIYFYQKESNYKEIPKAIAGLSILSDGSVTRITSDISTDTVGHIYLQLDTTADIRLNTPNAGGETRISISSQKRTGYAWGYGGYTIVYNSNLSVDAAILSGTNIEISLNATARVLYNGVSEARSQIQVGLMKRTGSIGDKFYLPQKVNKSHIAMSSGRSFECIFKPNASHYDAVILVTDGIALAPNDCIYGFNDTSPDKLNKSSAVANLYNFTRDKKNEKLWKRIQTDFSPTDYAYALMSNATGTIATFPVSLNELMFSDFVKIDTNIDTGNVKLIVSETGNTITADSRSTFTFDESLFKFNAQKITVPLSLFSGNTAKVTFIIKANAPAGDERSLGSETFVLTLARVDESSMPVIALNKTTDNAQYLQYGPYRIRVNTLFARQLVARANAGLDTVLSMDTQLIQEPKLGEGNYVEVTFSRYDKTLHGDGWFKLYLVGAENNDADNSRSKDLCATGNVSSADETSLTLFLPYNADKTKTEKNNVFIGVVYSDKSFTTNAAEMQLFTFDAISKTFSPANDNATRTRGLTSRVLDAQTESMDFSGANALYFWEMFYYVPMMVFKRLLSESKFTEATQWIKYIWSPEGYLVHGQPAPYQWNVHPLQEETTWHASPLDSVDPDAVSQADPLHYKVATFMSYLDLLMARGDMAYRQLERDTLNEAKMWYVQALEVLGDEPYLAQGTGWASPRLTDAADETTQKATQQALLDVRQQTAAGELRTANSLTSLFLPQQNEKLTGYWQTLAQRLFNLRHNLSIDGQPLSLAVYAAPADPAALLSAAVNASQGGPALPTITQIPLYRFPVIVESARGLVNQLTQFGTTLLSIIERQDAEALSELLQTQGSELVLQSIAQQTKTIEEIDAEQTALEESRSGAQSRLDSYTALYDEDINTGERQVMDLSLAASTFAATATVSYTVAAGMDAVPNIYGVAFGGSRYGGIPRAIGTGIEIGAAVLRTAAERISQSEIYRRRRQEWDIQRNAAQSDVKQIDAQLASLAVRREAAVLQKTYLETQQSQTQAQLTFLQNKFSNKALYNWLRGKLSAIYYQFYDLTVSRCLMAQQAYNWALGTDSSFIRPGVWQGSYAGLMAGETLMLNLVQMEQSYLQKDEREKEVTRTVCLSEVYAALPDGKFTLADEITRLVTAGKEDQVGTDDNGLKVENKQLQAMLKLADLNIRDDYPVELALGNMRRIRQISVTLPALVGPYQDVRAVLSYAGSVVVPHGCNALAVSHGMNDSGQFQLDFNDSRWLPFEGIPVNDTGTLTLSFPDADSRQKTLLLSLTDIILHIRYTIVS